MNLEQLARETAELLYYAYPDIGRHLEYHKFVSATRPVVERFLNEAVKEKDEALDKAISTGKELISQVASHIHVTRTRHYHKIFDGLKD